MRGLTPSDGMLRRNRAAVTSAYAAQGFGYAVVVTSLPALKERQGVDDLVVTLIVLGVCVAAALGSFVADAISVRAGSRAALVTGLVLQACALPLIAVPSAPWWFLSAFAIYGVGLGCVDAASAMQGVVVQRAHGSPLLGGFFAGYTAAAIVGALVVAGASGLALSTRDGSVVAAGIALATAAVVALVVAIAGVRSFAVDRPAAREPSGARAPLPRRGIWIFGTVIMVAFVADSAVSTWSTVYLNDDLGAAAWLAPLGYGAYQVGVLATRLGTDGLLRMLGARRLVASAVVVAAVGCVAVALVPVTGVAIAGFALAGSATGALVPAAFGAAGDLDAARSDEILARVNVFNYAGAVVGAVAVGLLADAPGLGAGFLIPAVALLALLALVRAFAGRAGSAHPVDNLRG